MDRLAMEALRTYEQMDLPDLIALARKDDYAEVRSEGDFSVSVTCLLGML